jgi:hypothetical protein
MVASARADNAVAAVKEAEESVRQILDEAKAAAAAAEEAKVKAMELAAEATADEAKALEDEDDDYSVFSVHNYTKGVFDCVATGDHDKVMVSRCNNLGGEGIKELVAALKKNAELGGMVTSLTIHYCPPITTDDPIILADFFKTSTRIISFNFHHNHAGAAVTDILIDGIISNVTKSGSIQCFDIRGDVVEIGVAIRTSAVLIALASATATTAAASATATTAAAATTATTVARVLCFGFSHAGRSVGGIFSAEYPPSRYKSPSCITPLSDSASNSSLFSYHFRNRDLGNFADTADKIDRFSIDIRYSANVQ